MKKYTPEWWTSLTSHQVGNAVEDLVEAVLKKWNSRQNFAWMRLPDTKSARLNMLQANPADYVYRCGKTSGFIEVKGLAHEYRLPKGNLSQLPNLLKWSLAGNQDVVLVHHYVTGTWRAIHPNELGLGVPSWDLRFIDSFSTPEQALLSTGYFDGLST